MESVRLSCVACGHAGKIAAAEFERRKSESLNVNSLSAHYDKLVCTNCRGKRIRVENAAGKLLFDPDHLVPCRECGNPIPQQRLDLVPGTTFCTICTQDGEGPRKAEAWPQPPNKLKRCPRCQGVTEVRENGQDGSLFISCKTWGCWTAEFEGARSRSKGEEPSG